MPKPIIGTLLSDKELNHNKYYTNIKTNLSTNIGAIEQTMLNTSDCNSNDISVLARNAAAISGFSPDVCKHILLDFAKIKRQHVQTPNRSLINHHQSHPFILRRSQSFTSP